MNRYQKEYIHRINRVIDFIEQNLDKDLSVATLAGVANFSPFHFHRLFSAFTGETLNGFVKRIRIEKAASLLLHDKQQPISEVAWYCGYNNVSVFCRNFRDRFSMSAQEFRESNDYANSKIRQPESKNSKIKTSSIDYVCNVETIKKGGFIMKNNIQIKEMPSLKLVYTRHVGSFHLIGQAYGKLMQWAGPRGLLSNPDVKTVTVYHDNPAVTDIDKLRQSACITVESDVKTEGEFGNMSLPGGKHVVGSFEISPMEFEEAWNSVCVWLSESGYQPADGYPFELYHNNHEEHPEKKFIVDICIPVKPL
ncbi:MAG: AraC family transcriptional regulator [Bacteroidota bacterium]